MSGKNIVCCIIKIDEIIFNNILSAHGLDTPDVCKRRLAAFIETHYDEITSLVAHSSPLAVPTYSVSIYIKIDISIYKKIRRLLLTPQGAQVLALAYLGVLTEL